MYVGKFLVLAYFVWLFGWDTGDSTSIMRVTNPGKNIVYMALQAPITTPDPIFPEFHLPHRYLIQSCMCLSVSAN